MVPGEQRGAPTLPRPGDAWQGCSGGAWCRVSQGCALSPLGTDKVRV